VHARAVTAGGSGNQSRRTSTIRPNVTAPAICAKSTSTVLSSRTHRREYHPEAERGMSIHCFVRFEPLGKETGFAAAARQRVFASRAGLRRSVCWSLQEPIVFAIIPMGG
jgi:hypothetical protein